MVGDLLVGRFYSNLSTTKITQIASTSYLTSFKTFEIDVIQLLHEFLKIGDDFLVIYKEGSVLREVAVPVFRVSEADPVVVHIRDGLDELAHAGNRSPVLSAFLVWES